MLVLNYVNYGLQLWGCFWSWVYQLGLTISSRPYNPKSRPLILSLRSIQPNIEDRWQDNGLNMIPILFNLMTN